MGKVNALFQDAEEVKYERQQPIASKEKHEDYYTRKPARS